MIVYGTRGKELAKELVSQKCPNCDTQNSVELHVFQQYAHIFWIPFFPIGKKGISQCNNCKQVLQSKQMPPGLADTYDRLRAQEKTPVWMFSGLALLAVLIVAAAITSKQKDEKNTALIAAPHQGDVFEVKTKANQYTLYKVAEIKGDSAYLQLNNYETNKISGLSDLKVKGDAAYTEEIFSFSKAELKEMLQKGEIIDIQRQ